MRRCLVMLSMILGLAPAAFGQITAGTVAGTVRDETGGVLPGVDVVIKNRDTGVSRTIVTDTSGAFTVPGLLPGPYEITATLSGFQSAVQDFQLTVAQTAALNLTMKVGGATEQVTVAANATLTDARTSSLSALVPEKTIQELPLNGRNYINLATLQPGIIQFTEKSGTSSSTRGVQLNINGMGGRSNSYLIDGANMRGYAGIATVTAADSTLGVDTIQEFRVVTNSFSADYGRAMGGVINIVSKAGGNSLRGSAFEFFRDSKFDSKNYFDVGSAPPFKRNQFGGSFGGAIVKNKVFFFGGYERLQEDLGITELLTVPTAAARAGAVASVQPYINLYPLPNGADLGGGVAQYNYAFNRPTRENFGQGRVDIQFSDKHSLFVRETVDKAHQLLPSGTVSLPQFQTNSESDNQFATAEEKWVVSPTLLNTARYSHSILKFDQLPQNQLTDPLSFFPQAPYMGSIGVPGLTSLGNDSTLPSTNDIKYDTYSDDLSWTKGRHFIKTGVLVEHSYSEKQTTTNSRGGYTFSSMASFLAGVPTRFVGVLPGAQLERDRPSTLFGVYLQDDLRWTDRLTLNLGLRYERYTVPTDANGLDAYLADLYTSSTTTVGAPFVNPSNKDFAPRLGFAYDISGNGKTVLRGGSGVYYDTDNPYNSAFGISAFTPPFAPQVTLTNPSFPSPVLPSNVTQTGALSLRTLDHNIQQPMAWTYNVNVQRELPGQMVVMVGYAGSRGYHLVSAVEGNPNVPVIQADGSYFFPANATRRNPAWTSVDYRTSNGHSTYNSLQTQLQKRLSNSFQFQVSYTLAHVMDNTQAQLAVDSVNTSVYPMNPYDPNADWADASFDIRHVFATNATWQIPYAKGNAILGGWELNGIMTLRSGLPFSPSIATSNWSNSGNTSGEDRPNVKAGVDPASLIIGDPAHWFDTSAFSMPAKGTFGNTPRNFLRGPGFADVDASLVRNVSLRGSAKVQLRIECFNILNRANFAVPSRAVFAGSSVNDPVLATAGQITHTTNPSRQMQFSAKFSF